MAFEVETPPPAYEARDERSMGQLFRRLRDETTTLFRQEVQLAKTETMEKARTYGRSGVVLAIGGALGLAALLLLLASWAFGFAALLVLAGLSEVTSSWLSPLITGVVLAIIAYAMVRKGLNAMKRESPVPERTVRSLQENQQWVKQKLS